MPILKGYNQFSAAHRESSTAPGGDEVRRRNIILWEKASPSPVATGEGVGGEGRLRFPP